MILGACRDVKERSDSPKLFLTFDLGMLGSDLTLLDPATRDALYLGNMPRDVPSSRIVAIGGRSLESRIGILALHTKIAQKLPSRSIPRIHLKSLDVHVLELAEITIEQR